MEMNEERGAISSWLEGQEGFGYLCAAVMGVETGKSPSSGNKCTVPAMPDLFGPLSESAHCPQRTRIEKQPLMMK